MIGKYVERFVKEKNNDYGNKKEGKSSVDMQFLAKSGFL